MGEKERIGRSPAPARLAIDFGGTFTDVAIDGPDRIFSAKAPIRDLSHTAMAAMADYGVAVTEDLTLDAAATKTMRRNIRQAKRDDG